MRETIVKCDRCGVPIKAYQKFEGEETVSPTMDGPASINGDRVTWVVKVEAQFQHQWSDGPVKADLCGECVLAVVRVAVGGNNK